MPLDLCIIAILAVVIAATHRIRPEGRRTRRPSVYVSSSPTAIGPPGISIDVHQYEQLA